MQKSLLKFLLSVAALALSATVHALGMGGINVTSALGQQLQADIELVAVGKAERGSLVARLASADAYKSAGLEYPHGNKFKFQIENRANGEPYLRLSSEQPINDPFVSLLVELTWPSGKMSREYTFLLDPPGYVAEQPVQPEVKVVAPAAQVVPAEVVAQPVEEVQTAAPVEQAVPVETITAPVEQAIPTEAAAPAATMAAPEGQTVPAETAAAPSDSATASEGQPVPAETAPAEPAAAPAEPAAVSGEQAVPKVAPTLAEERSVPVIETRPGMPERLTVPRGSTLSGIAEQYKPADASVERMLVALYRINVDEFEGKNMNRISAGKVLRMPAEQDLMNVTQSDAEKEIRVQAADWNAYRQKLAGTAAVGGQPQATQQVAVGKISSSVIDNAPVAKESAKEVLKLSKGEAPGDQAAAAAGGKGMSAQDKKNAAQEEAIAKAKAREAEQARAALLEKNLKDMQRLAQLKSEAAALAAKSSDALPKAETAPKKAETATKVEAPVASAAKVESAAKPKPKAIEPEPTLVDKVLAEPLYLAGGAAVLLGLGGFGFVMNRRKKETRYGKKEKSSEDVGSVSSRITAPVVPSPETGDFTHTAETAAVAQAVSAQEPDSVDPISEADLFLSFGRDGQAEEILKEALKEMPGNQPIRLKLLGIYANRQDVGSFGAIAREIKDSGDEHAWQQALEMGRKLEPDNPMYGGFRSMEDTGSATVQMAAFNVAQPADNAPATPSVLDFDFNLNAPQDNAAPSPEQNLLGDMEKTTILSASDMAEEQMAAMDFDVTSTHPMAGQAEKTPAAAEDMIFDVTGSQEMPAAQPEYSKPAESTDGGMAFTLDFPVEKAVEKSAPEPAAGLAGINLNFDDVLSQGEPSSGGKGEQWQEVATKLDLAKAYQEMGDASGAREILDEVMREGDAEQREAAQSLLAQLG